MRITVSSVLAFGLLIFVSCENDSAPIVTKYTDLNPDSCMCSTPATMPLPARTDSTVQRDVDLDGNGINDLRVEFKQFRYFISPLTQPIVYTGTLIRLNSRLEIEYGDNSARSHNAGDKIYGADTYWQRTDLSFVSSGHPYSDASNYSGEKYFVYRIENDHGTYDYGWIRIYHDYHTVCIRDFTYSSDSPITTAVR